MAGTRISKLIALALTTALMGLGLAVAPGSAGATPGDTEWVRERYLDFFNQPSGRASAVDGAGNVYVAGNRAGTLGFVEKHDKLGNLQWAWDIPTGATADGVAITPEGDVVVVGTTNVVASITDAAHTVTSPIANQGASDGFVAELSSSGAVRWVTNVGGSSTDQLYGVTADASGNVYAVGTSYAGTTAPQISETAAGLRSLIVSFDSDGVARYTHLFGPGGDGRFGGEATSFGVGISAGQLVIGGHVMHSSPPSAGDFVLTFDPNSFAPGWSASFGSSNSSQGVSGVAVDPATGNIFVSGSTIESVGPAQVGFTDAYLRSYTSGGSLRFTQTLGTPSQVIIGNAVAVDGFGHVFLAGQATGAVPGAPEPDDGATLADDAFVAAYRADGSSLWTHLRGGPTDDRFRGIAASGQYVYAVGGTFSSPGWVTMNVAYENDLTNPTTSVATPASGAFYRRGASVPSSYSCADEVDGSGLDVCTGSVASGAAIDTATEGAKSFGVIAADRAGNPAGRVVPYTVDGTAPTATISVPANGATYQVGSSLTASYSCTDGSGSGVATGGCSGPVASGAGLSLATTGAKTFTVHSVDRVGNARDTTVSYTVIGFGITTASLVNGHLGTPYSQTLTAVGGTAPYKWKRIGKLPKGLKLTPATGVISGIPKKLTGPFTFTVQVTDKAKPKKVTSKTLTITIS